MGSLRSVLVTGRTGRLGRPVVAELVRAGHRVRVLSRRAAPATDAPPYEWATGDLRADEGIEAAVAGIDVVVNCATTNGRGDVAATETLVSAAEAAGVSHLIHLSIVGVDRIPLGYYRAKLASEQVVERSSLGWTIQRATQFHDLLASMFVLPAWMPFAFAVKGIKAQPIDVGEVAVRLAELVAGEPVGRASDIGGPQVLSTHELAKAGLAAAGRRRPILPLPIGGRTAAAYRHGYNLTPDHAVGRITFAEFLATKGSADRKGDRAR